MFRVTNPARDEFLNEARAHIGYTARPGRESVYGQQTGYNGLPWDGSFIDVIARRCGVSDSLPRLVYTPAGLSEFFRTGLVVTRPQPGDIVFFTFSTGTLFEAPHVGVVTDVTGWDRYGSFKCVEGMTDSGMPKAQSVPEGVYERVRYRTDVLIFGRAAWGRKKFTGHDGQETTVSDVVKVSAVQPGNRRPLAQVRRVQDALVLQVSLGDFQDGVFDGSTRAAYSAWQRRLGYVGKDANGIPDLESLRFLGNSTRLFRVEE